ncbi:MAG: late competence development ComFB family protein [Clostridiales bacterium]|nr:late competence development ComFB family protein [Clostridiales bacterium]
MPKKTNKTSHVLNLITSGGSPEPEEKVTEVDPQKREEKRAPKEETAVQAAAVEEPAAQEQITRLPSTDKNVLVIDETSQNDKLSSKILDSLTDEVKKEEEREDREDNCHMVNVMEQIIKGMNLRRYMEQYEVCLCSRCQADVFALILTRLPAKYVVVAACPTAPIISFYESKFRVRIITEIIKACIDVKENPRHGRLDPDIL